MKDAKTILLELINTQKQNITSEYMRGLYNGFITAYNSLYDDTLDLINIDDEIIKDSPINKIDDSIMITSDMLG